MSRLNWNRPRRMYTAWYEADILPWDARFQAPAQKPRAAIRPKRPRPTTGQPPSKSIAAAADAFAGPALLRTSDLYEARDALCEAVEATVYCDGSCEANPGPMGFGAVIVTAGGRVEMLAGGMDGTNNAAELAAAQMALEALPVGCRVTVFADSQYLIHGVTKWAANRAKRLKRGTVPNADLWRAIDTLNARRSIEWHWVRGHNGNRGNEIADRLATLGRGRR